MISLTSRSGREDPEVFSSNSRESWAGTVPPHACSVRAPRLCLPRLQFEAQQSRVSLEADEGDRILVVGFIDLLA